MQTLTVADVGEHALIERITARLSPRPWVIVGPGDDAAVVEPDRGAVEVLTTDAQVESVHFDRRFVPPDAIGHRALAVNLSDLAAMGAEPRCALLSLMLPATLEVSVVDGIMDGLLQLADAHRVALIGGNITRSPGPLIVDVTATGSVRRRRILTRAGARPGDEVYVTGSLGDAAVGLRSLQRACGAHGGGTRENAQAQPRRFDRCEERYLRPAARVRAGVVLGRNNAATSCIDLSDGLADGIRQIATASGVGMTIDAKTIPLAADVREWHAGEEGNAIDGAISSGDDYELLFTARPKDRGRLRAVKRQVGDLPITRIGVVTRSRDLLMSDEMGKRELPSGFVHFG